jgi:hypothetical protein
MTDAKGKKGDYYFVPLGRERGGFLDRLALPPDADAKQVAAKEREYRKRIAEQSNQERKKWAEELEARNITQEEFEAKVEAIRSEKTRRETEINELKKKFRASQADRRALENSGRRDTTSAWADLIDSFPTPHAFWQFLVALRPLPRFSAEHLDALLQRWLTSVGPGRLVAGRQPEDQSLDLAADLALLDSNARKRREKWFRDLLQRSEARRKKELGEQVEAGTLSRTDAADALTAHREGLKRAWEVFLRELAAARSAVGRPSPPAAGPSPGAANGFAHHGLFVAERIDLRTLAGLVAERDAIALLAADALWHELQGTNRGFWRRQVAAWTEEIARLGPDLEPQCKQPSAAAARPEFPSLSQPLDRTIDRLEAAELGELAQQPDRKKPGPDQPLPDLDRLFRALLGRSMAGQSAEAADDAAGSAAEAPMPGAAMALAELAKLLNDLGTDNE